MYGYMINVMQPNVRLQPTPVRIMRGRSLAFASWSMEVCISMTM
jgi:hypothetical protein